MVGIAYPKACRTVRQRGVGKTQTPLGGKDAGASQLVAIFTACSQLQKDKIKRPQRLAGSEKGIMNYGKFTNI